MNFTNSSEQMPCERGSLPLSLIFQAALYAIVCFIGLVGNSLVIYVVMRFSKMQTVTNMYIVNLAIADECFIIGIPFLLVTIHKNSWIFGDIMCKAYLILTSLNQYTSSLFLFIMSADRYIAVCHPISSPKWRTPFIARVVSMLAWICSMILMIPILIHSNEIVKCVDYATNETSKSCVINWGNSTQFSSPKTFILYTFVFSFALPLSLILIFYIQVIQKLKTVGPQNKSKEKKRSHRKVTNLVLTVVTVYVLCWTPYWITQIALTFRTEDENSPQSSNSFVLAIHLLASCLSYSNSAMNPVLYAFLSDNFKKSFLKACTCAAGKDFNATLYLENSVFPRKNKQGSAKFRQTRGTSICPNNDDEGDLGPLVSKGDPSTSAITMTSRSVNVTESKETTPPKDTIIKNGITFSANL